MCIRDRLSLAIGREGQNVRLAARLTGWKIDIKNSHEYDQATEDSEVAELISQREEEESLQREAEQRLEAEQAARAEEDARLRELYPIPEDEEDFQSEQISDINNDETDIEEITEESSNSEDKITTQEEGTR